MIGKIKFKLSTHALLITAALMTTLLWCAPDASAQTGAASPPPQSGSASSATEEAAGTDAATGPVFKDYKGVRIGMSADEVRQKLGKPESKGEKQDFFLVSDNEMVQIYYDKDGKANAVSITYSGKNAAAPTALAVLGEDVAAGADGRVYKLVRYPTVGYWIAYSRTAGDAPIVSVTMKKMQVFSK